jgi:GT2 family glycosyltransferase
VASEQGSGAAAVTLLLNYKRADLTVQCLEQLRAAVTPDHHVLLLDNGSGVEEEAALRVAASGHANVELRLLRFNHGYCAAINLGIAWAAERAARYVLLLNNDVTVEPGFLDILVDVLDHDPSLAGVGPTILRPDGMVWSQGGETGFCPNLSRLNEQGRVPAARSTGPAAVGFLPGACALYRLDDLLAVHGLDESYFMYFEDIALGQAIRDRGRRLLWLPWVRVGHDAGSSSGGSRSPLRKYLMAANSIRYLRRHFSLGLWIALFLFDCVGLPWTYVTDGRRVGWAKTLGILHGLRGRQITESDVSRWLTP